MTPRTDVRNPDKYWDSDSNTNELWHDLNRPALIPIITPHMKYLEYRWNIIIDNEYIIITLGLKHTQVLSTTQIKIQRKQKHKFNGTTRDY